jgi:hypothetical protein
MTTYEETIAALKGGGLNQLNLILQAAGSAVFQEHPSTD